MKRIGKLFNKIFNKENYLEAINNIKGNKGSKTTGFDNENINDILKDVDGYYNKIILEKLKNFQPDPVRRVEIPKPNGKTRPLGIPTIRDRVIQQMFKQVLEPIVERKFHEHSFGFRPQRSAHHAIARNNNLINRGKLYYCVDIDIKGFFDNINHKKLIKSIWKIGIQDKTVISLIKKMLKAPIYDKGNLTIPDKGTPQGGILSPLLANIYLNEFDWWINKQWSGIKINKAYVRQRTKENSLKKTNLREVKLVRYADDFKLFCRKRKDAEYFYKISEIFLKDKLKLEISKEKSKIINLRRECSEFLGFKIKAVEKNTTHSNYVAKLRLNEKAVYKIIKTLKDNIQEIRIESNKKERIKKVIKFNSTVLGIHNYYKVATHVTMDFAKISFIITKTLYNKFGTPTRIKDERYKMKFKRCKSKVWNINDITLFTIGYIQHKNPMQYSKHSKIIETKLTLENDSDELYKRICISENSEWAKRRAELHCKSSGKCYVTGEYLKFDKFAVHHIIPKEYGGSDDMKNLVLLSKEIHLELHKKYPNENLLKNMKFVELRKIILKNIK